MDTYFQLNAVEQEIFNTEIAKFDPEQHKMVLRLTQLEDLAKALLDFSDVADFAPWFESRGQG